MTRFFLGLFTALALPPAVFGLVLAVLDAGGRLPPPAFSGRWDVDRKLQDLRAGRPERIDLLLLGSSTTFYGVDGGLLGRLLPDRPAVFHASSPGLKVHQTLFLARFYLDRFPEVRRAVMVSTPLDFERCAPGEARLFPPQEVARYLAGRGAELLWQLRRPDPGAVWRALGGGAAAAMPLRRLDLPVLDPYGGQLVDPPPEAVPEAVRRGVFPDPDPRCYRALAELAGELAARGVVFLFAQAPLRPSYLAAYDAGGARLARHLARVRAIVEERGGRVLDLHRLLALPEEAFFDAYHIRAPFVRRQTEALAAALAAPAPPLPEVAFGYGPGPWP